MSRFFLAFWLLVSMINLPTEASATELVTGMNVNTTTDRNLLVEQLGKAKVSVVRCSLNNASAASLDLARQLLDQGIKVDAMVGCAYPANAPVRPKGRLRSARPLSWADPQLSKKQYQTFMDKLDEKGIVLAGLELGNEINWADFNGDFPVPGKGKIFGLEDLSNDPEAKKVAAGFLQYLKCLKALKEVRDHSKLNQNTPIISAGLADCDLQSPWPKPADKMDIVTTDATLDFMKEHGLDELVDAYGIHRYPKEKTPEARRAGVRKAICRNCRPGKDKPFWMTEWGVDNQDTNCPPDDAARTAEVVELMKDFRALAKEGRLASVLYFSWNYGTPEKPGSTIFRCNELLKSGKKALER